MPIFIGAVAALSLKAIAAGLAILAVIAILTFQAIVSWFRARTDLKLQDKDNIAFSLQEKLKTGKYKTVHGIFNSQTEELLDYNSVESNDIDEELRDIHCGNEIVVYE